jgi:hypothetical protein
LLPKDFVLINVNANQRRKDVMRSLEILRGLIDRGLPAKLIMHMPHLDAGDLINLYHIAKQLGLENGKHWIHNGIYFQAAQQIPENEMWKFYAAADLYLSTSLGEGWGLPACEALACGTPIALPEHTSCAEIMDGLRDRGMGERVVRLPVEKHRIAVARDNTRLRQRVDVDGAVEAIVKFYQSGVWRTRVGINSLVMEWWNWNRIADDFLRLMKPEIETMPEVIESPVPEVQTAATPETISPSAEEIFRAPALKAHYDCIPMIGVPIINRGDLLRRMVASIDYPVGLLVILVNEHPVKVQEDVEQAVRDLMFDSVAGKYPFIGEVRIMRNAASRNLGVAASWNLLGRFSVGLPYCIFVGNDIQFAPGDLKKMRRATMERLDHVMLFGNWGHSFFAITELAWKLVGDFDENIYPAYLEDCDHSRRLNLLGAKAFNVQEIKSIHGDTDSCEVRDQGSCTIRSDAEMLRRNAITHGNNFLYYEKKWGGINDHEKYTNPFNDPTWPVNVWHKDPELAKAQSVPEKFVWLKDRAPFKP